MVSVFEESLADAYAQSGGRGVVTMWLRVLADLLSSALSERSSHFAASFGIERKSALAAAIGIHTLIVLIMIWVGLHTIPPRNPCAKENLKRASTLSMTVPTSLQTDCAHDKKYCT
jgi:hypothetical protein